MLLLFLDRSRDGDGDDDEGEGDWRGREGEKKSKQNLSVDDSWLSNRIVSINKQYADEGGNTLAPLQLETNDQIHIDNLSDDHRHASSCVMFLNGSERKFSLFNSLTRSFFLSSHHHVLLSTLTQSPVLQSPSWLDLNCYSYVFSSLHGESIFQSTSR